MAIVNLKDYYPFYTSDCFIEVSEEVAETFKEFERKEAAYRLRTYRHKVFFASTFSSKMQIDFLKVAWGISPVLHFPLRHSFRCRRGAVAGIQSLLVTDM